MRDTREKRGKSCEKSVKKHMKRKTGDESIFPRFKRKSGSCDRSGKITK
jgi:hypothetical protein